MEKNGAKTRGSIINNSGYISLPKTIVLLMQIELLVLKKLMWALIPFCLVVSCNEETSRRKGEIATLSGMRLSPLVDSLLREYVKAVPNEHAYAICIDKKSEGMSDFAIHIAPFNKNAVNLYEAGATNYLLINDTVPVFIYSGLEDFVVCDTAAYRKARDFSSERELSGEFRDWDPINRNIDFSRSWAYVRVKDKAYVVKGDNFPFSKETLLLPIIYFQPSSDSTLDK